MSSRYRRKIAAAEHNSRRHKVANLEWLHNLIYQRTGCRVRSVNVSSDAALDKAITAAKAALETPTTKTSSRIAVIGDSSKIGMVLAAELVGLGGSNKEIS